MHPMQAALKYTSKEPFSVPMNSSNFKLRDLHADFSTVSEIDSPSPIKSPRSAYHRHQDSQMHLQLK